MCNVSNCIEQKIYPAAPVMLISVCKVWTWKAVLCISYAVVCYAVANLVNYNSGDLRDISSRPNHIAIVNYNL